MTYITPFLENLTTFNAFILVVSVFIFLFAGKIVNSLDTSDLEKRKMSEKIQKNINKKIKFLRYYIFVIFITYFITFYTEISFINGVISSLFIILISYMINSWLVRRIVLFYGEEVEISGNKYIRRDYKTNLFSLISHILTFLIVVFVIMKIFGVDSILENGGIIAWILAFTGFTAPVWAPDLVAGISILHHDEIQVGNVVKIKNKESEKDLIAWVKNISLSEVKLIDLVYYHPIIMRTSKFRELQVENLSRWVSSKKSIILQIIDIKVDYKHSLEEVEKVCKGAFNEMIDNFAADSVERKYFPEDVFTKIEIESFWDNAIHYKFSYNISSPFYVIKARRILNTFLQKHQKANKLSFATPKLIDLQWTNK